MQVALSVARPRGCVLSSRTQCPGARSDSADSHQARVSPRGGRARGVVVRASLAGLPLEVDMETRRKIGISSANKHAQTARENFVGIVERGEATLDLARAALYIACEDDALGTGTG